MDEAFVDGHGGEVGGGVLLGAAEEVREVDAPAAGAGQDRGPVGAGEAVLDPAVGIGTVRMDEVDGGLLPEEGTCPGWTSELLVPAVVCSRPASWTLIDLTAGLLSSTQGSRRLPGRPFA